MAIVYKMDVLNELKKKGITTYTIRQKNIFGQRTVTQLRHGELVSWATINTICRLLDCKPGDLLDYVPDAPGQPRSLKL